MFPNTNLSNFEKNYQFCLCKGRKAGQITEKRKKFAKGRPRIGG